MNRAAAFGTTGVFVPPGPVSSFQVQRNLVVDSMFMAVLVYRTVVIFLKIIDDNVRS